MPAPSLILGCTGSLGVALTIETLRPTSTVAPQRPARSIVAMVRDEDAARARLARFFPALAQPNSGLLRAIVGSALGAEDIARAASQVDPARDQGGPIIINAVRVAADQSQHADRIAANILQAARRLAQSISLPVTLVHFTPSWALAAPTSPEVNGRPARLKEAADLSSASPQARRAAAEEKAIAAMVRETKGAVRAVIVRAPPLFGPGVRSPGCDRIFRSALRGEDIAFVGDLDRPVQWAYTPDLARAVLDLLELRAKLSPIETVHFSGHTFNTQREFIKKVCDLAGKSLLNVTSTPWLLARAAGIFGSGLGPLAGERHVWSSPVLLDGSRLRSLVPSLALTDIEIALDETLHAFRSEPKPAEARA